jgi:phosphoribosyl 1,2-cyclic phosphodiesterase
MKITIWGCRGSLPAPGPEKSIYGGNTSCVQVSHKNTTLIFDGGSGIQRLGASLDPDIKVVHILLSHLHLDHIMGLGYFSPFYDPDFTINIWGPAGSNESLVARLRHFFSPPFFPVRLNELPAKINFVEIDNSTFIIGDFTITSEYLCHPGPTVGFRCTAGTSVFTYIPDHEPALGSYNFIDPEWCSGFNLAYQADLLIHDGQYTVEEYKDRMGWGHCSIDDAIQFGELAEVKKLVFFHYDPARSDTELEQMFLNSTHKLQIPFDIMLGRENEVFYLE